MIKIDKRVSRVLLLGAAVAPFGAALAAEGSRRIEEVIVTAERQEASIQDTSISITAFTDQFIDDFGIRNQEDLQNFVPATTIQPYDATVRGVGRNFRALGGDPGVATYMNGVYSEDLLTATAATFWDVQRIEVLRGPQGTLYGRNAVGGAINILYKEPTYEGEWAFKSILGNFGTQEYYGMVSGPLVDDVLAARLNFSLRDRDGAIKEIGGGADDLDGLGTDNIALQLKWNPTDTFEVNLRQNQMKIDRSFGGANGGGLVVLNEENAGTRNTTDLIPGYRAVDANQTNPLASDFLIPGARTYSFQNPNTGATVTAQHNRPGMDYADFDGFQNAAASLDGFNNTSAASAAAYNACVFPGDISGSDVCAATNGLNREEFDQQGTQMTASWDFSENLTLKYIYGYNKLSYRRTTDDDNTGSLFIDRQFYVNHEADYSSHEIQAFYDFSENLSVTAGAFIYDATIDQRGDFYSTIRGNKFEDAYVDTLGLSSGASAVSGIPAGLTLTNLLGGRPQATLHAARDACAAKPDAVTCQRNYSVENSNASLSPLVGGPGTRSDNLYIAGWQGDDGTHPDLDVQNGPNTRGSDLLYHTQTVRDAFAAYAQGVWDINDAFTLTVGIRYAEDQILAEENLYRYTESNLAGALGLYSSVFTATPSGGSAIYDLNVANGGFVMGDATTCPVNVNAQGVCVDLLGQPTATVNAVNGGIPVSISVYRPFERTDKKTTGRINLDWNLSDSAMMYFSATSGYRSGGYNLVFFSTTPTYDPEELIAYEIGYKSQFADDTIQLNASTYYYDYTTVHTVATEISVIGGTSTSVLEAPGAEIFGIEAELLWLASDNLTLGGNFSFTPSEYTEDLFVKDTAGFERPTSLFPAGVNDATSQVVNIKGNQLLQVPELKYTGYASYRIPMNSGNLDISGVYSWTDEVYYSPFQTEREKTQAYGRTDLRASWSSTDNSITVAAFVNNIFDDVAVLQILRGDEAKFYRQSAGTTLPRMFGIEFTYQTAGM